ncbi:MAG: kinase [Geodermatophilaceae bacterium]|nr:kinase [Geodermatophilaceae bacterium]
MPRNLAPQSSDFDDEPRDTRTTKSGRRSRWDDGEAPVRPHRASEDDVSADVSGLPDGSRWSTWDDIGISHGPTPHPEWVVTALGAIDHELGVLKTGKEADVFLVDRAVPDTDIGVLMAAKRYRSNEHRMFHRDAGYVEGRRVRESRMNRAMAKRTSFGRDLLAGQWAVAEFEVLSAMYSAGAPVPYPVQIDGTELLLEFIGDPDGTAAPRLAQMRAETADLHDLYRQCIDAMCLLAASGLAHGDLSAYNLLVHQGRLVVIDVPQAINIVANPRGPEFLRRDAENVCRWFCSHGVPADAEDLTALLLDEARML